MKVSVRRLHFFLRKFRHPIPRGALVVDIGSGGDPHPRADVLVDMHIESGGERTAAFLRSACTVVADVHALPFWDGAFGYSICSHLLEHVDDPVLAAEEISRISLAGYVETPSDLHEKLMPIGWHRWFVRRHHDVLVFEAKPSPFLDERMGEYFRSQWGRDRSFMRWAWKHVDEHFLQHHWNGSLHVEAIELGGPACREIVEVDANDDAAEFDLMPGSRSKRNVYDLLARLRYR